MTRSGTPPSPSARQAPARLSQCRPPTPKAEGVSLTRLENYCVAYLATLESRDVICASWRPAAQFRVRSCAIRFVLTGSSRAGSPKELPNWFSSAPTNRRHEGVVALRLSKSSRQRFSHPRSRFLARYLRGAAKKPGEFMFTGRLGLGRSIKAIRAACLRMDWKRRPRPTPVRYAFATTDKGNLDLPAYRQSARRATPARAHKDRKHQSGTSASRSMMPLP